MSAEKGAIHFDFDPDVKNEITEEFGTLGKFYERLEQAIRKGGVRDASIEPSSEIGADGATTRGGGVEIIVELSSLIGAITPIVVAWFKSHNLVVVLKQETSRDGVKKVEYSIKRGA